MSNLIQSLIVIYAMGCMDRVSGDKYDLGLTKWAERLAYGWLVAVLMGHSWDIFTLPTAVAMAFGRASGWGEPLGAALERRKMLVSRLEWWQKASAGRHTWTALWLRGAIWGACFLPIAWFDPHYLIVSLAYTLAFPSAVYVERRFGSANWEWQERWRGWIAGALIIVWVKYVQFIR